MKIYIDDKEYDYQRHICQVSFHNIVNIWNELNAPRRITGNPGIDFHDAADGSDGILLPTERVIAKDGTRFNITPYHNG